MYPFAVELWIHIIRELSRDDLLSTSRTCSTFRNIAQAQLYNDIQLKKPDDFILLARSLAERPEIASLVFKLQHMVHDRVDVFTSRPVLLHISSFSNLHKLELNLIRIDSGLCAALQALPSLQVISWAWCEIDPDLDAPQTQMSWGRNISTVIIFYPKGPEADWTALIPPTIQTLDIHVIQVTGFSVFTTETLILALITQSQRLEFTTLILKFSAHIPRNIASLLISCPHLRQITLETSFQAEHVSFSELPVHSLPVLEGFTGAARHMDSFIASRRIHSVDISIASNEDSNVLASLHRSVIPVTKLRLRAHGIKVRWLRCIPLTLCTLELYEDDLTSNFDPSWILPLRNMPTLCTLRIVGSRLSTEEQVELVEIASALCHALREFAFEWEELKDNREIQTGCTWHWKQELPWECYRYKECGW